MTVYKFLRLMDKNLWSPYQDFRWELNELYKTDIKESKDWIGFDSRDSKSIMNKYPLWEPNEDHAELKCFGSGFHSALSIKRISSAYSYADEAIYECTIPKGSEYYIGVSELIVSNQIIINKKVK